MTYSFSHRPDWRHCHFLWLWHPWSVQYIICESYTTSSPRFIWGWGSVGSSLPSYRPATPRRRSFYQPEGPKCLEWNRTSPRSIGFWVKILTGPDRSVGLTNVPLIQSSPVPRGHPDREIRILSNNFFAYEWKELTSQYQSHLGPTGSFLSKRTYFCTMGLGSIPLIGTYRCNYSGTCSGLGSVQWEQLSAWYAPFLFPGSMLFPGVCYEDCSHQAHHL